MKITNVYPVAGVLNTYMVTVDGVLLRVNTGGRYSVAETLRRLLLTKD